MFCYGDNLVTTFRSYFLSESSRIPQTDGANPKRERRQPFYSCNTLSFKLQDIHDSLWGEMMKHLMKSHEI